MKKITFLLLFLSFAFIACEDKYPDLENGVYAEFITNKGTFVAKLYHEATPLTVANFVDLATGENSMVDSTYAGKPYFDGIIFHRVIADFMIQGGDPLGNGTGSPGYKFPDEIVDTLRHSKKGLLSMANSGPRTNGSQFFVTLKETPWLDGKHTIFGEVVLGMDIVEAIGVVPTEKPADRPIDPVIMEDVNIINKGSNKVASFVEMMEIAEKEKQERLARLQKVATDRAVEFALLKEEAETTESGLQVYFNERGDGDQPAIGSKVMINYAGFFTNGDLFDSNMISILEEYDAVDHRSLDAGRYTPKETDYSPDAQLIAGFREALLMMKPGDNVTVYVPSHLAYGERGYPPKIPANADLIFILELVEEVK